ncbi:MAG: hypothetical protein J6L64_02395 [Opitutales bacterium]|nr:hypothetical protein [Opitutales bacterium]
MDEQGDFGFFGSGVDGSVAVNANVRVSAADLARMLGIETADVARLERHGITQRTGRGEYVLESSVRGYADYLRGKISEKPKDQLDLVKTETAKVELEQLLGTLIRKEDALMKIAAVITAARRVLESVGVRLAPIIAEKTDIHEIRNLIDHEIFNALETIADAKIDADAGTAPAGEPDSISPGNTGTLSPDTPSFGQRLG